MGKLKTCAEGLDARAGRSSRVQGVSLIEVMIALAILGYGMLGVAAAQISAFKATDQSRERMLAHALAQQQLEQFQEMSSTSLEVIRTDGGYPNDPLNPIDPDPNDAMQMAFNRSWTITPDTPEDDVYTIMVSVGWTNSKGAQIVQLETFKSEL
jgi:prepilin-type N-terminal cleavage/methylation domain-containing protein